MASNRKHKADALLDITNYSLREGSIGCPNSVNESWLEDIIKEMLNLHKAEPNQQPKPDAWPLSNFNIPKDLECGQGQSDAEQDGNGPGPNAAMQVSNVGVDACHLILVDVNMEDGDLGDERDEIAGERLCLP